jgi:HlyD family secretion protein
VAIVVIAAAAFYVWTLVRPRPARPAITTVPVTKGSILGVVSSTGQIAAWTQARLTFQEAGRIASIPVKVGDKVKKGDVVATLDPTQLQLEVQQQQANLEIAQARLAAMKAGARPEDIQTAQAVLDGAKAKLAEMQAQGRPETIQSAKDALASAKAKLHELQQGPQAGDVAVAQAAVQTAETQLSQAQSNLTKLTAPPDPLDIQNAQLQVTQAKNLLWQKQVDRDGVCGDGTAANYKCVEGNSMVAQAQSQLDQYVVKLNQLKEPPKPEDVASAKAAVDAATAALSSSKAKLAQLQAGSLPDDIAQAEQVVAQAEQNLQLQQNPFTDQDIEQQKQAVVQAQAALALKQTPYLKTDIDQAQAQVDQAQAALDYAKSSLASSTLVAPFDGVISTVNENVGDFVANVPPTLIVSMVDPTNIRLDASVDETDIPQVQLGQDVNVTFDALPGKTFPGKVLSIAPGATVQSGVATYTVSITVPNDSSIKPGMTGNADIVYARHDDVLLVPNRAVRTQGAQHFVALFDGTRQKAQPVTIGVSDDQSTEVLSGVQAGDQIVVPSTSAATPAFAGGARRATGG